MAWTTPATWTAGETVTASKMNTHVRDELLYLYSLTGGLTWTEYGPTLTNLSVGNGTLGYRYFQVGKFVVARVDLVWGSTTSSSGAWAITLPVTHPAGTGSPILGVGEAVDFSASQSWDLRVRIASTTTFRLLHSDGASAAILNTTVPFTWATSDEMHALLIYEAA